MNKGIFLSVIALVLWVNFAFKSNNEPKVKDMLCGDLLEMYAKKPKKLQFLNCEKIENSQTLVKATYRVSGLDSKEVEEFLVEAYNMGKLKWVCCGWESGGEMGSFQHKKSHKIDPYLVGEITMGANAEIPDEENPTGVRLEFERKEIEWFIVTVTLSIV